MPKILRLAAPAGLAALGLLLVLFSIANAQRPEGLESNLVVCWDFEEPSGTRYDLVGSNDLTEYNTVGQVDGVTNTGYACQVVSANSEILGANDSADLSVAGHVSFTLLTWIYNDDATAACGPISKYYPNDEYRLYRSSTPSYVFYVYDADCLGGAGSVAVGPTLTETWNMIVAWHDPDADELYIDVNNGSISATNAHADGICDSNSGFKIGGRKIGSLHCDDRYDTTAIWQRTLTDEEIDWLYAAGDGRDCSAILTPEPTVTPTPTPSPTPFPGVATYAVVLPSNATAAVEASATYGELILVLAVVLLLLIILYSVLRDRVMAWYNR